MQITKSNALRIATVLLSLCGAIVLPVSSQTYEYDGAGRLIRAVYPDGSGAAYAYDDSDNLISVTPLAIAPSPMNVSAVRTQPNQARVSWDAVSGATGYVVERRSAETQVWSTVAEVSADLTSFVDGSIAPGTDYLYRIRANTPNGQTAISEEAGFVSIPTPVISDGGVVNGATFSNGVAIAPGSIISIFGQNIAVRIGDAGLETFEVGAAEVPLPTEMGGYSVLINGVPAPLFYVGGRVENDLFVGQINAQVPWETPLGFVNVSIRRTEGEQVLESSPEGVLVAAVSPGVFMIDFGGGRAAAQNRRVEEPSDVIDFSFAQLTDSIPGADAQPAPLGGVLTLFANGLGPTDPVAVTGNNNLDALRRTTIPLKVFIGGAEAEILFSGLAPEFVGLNQIDVRVPLGTPPGAEVTVVIETGGLQSRGDVTIAVRAP
jgi:uncharacterized protein (TIGR03437 family)